MPDDIKGNHNFRPIYLDITRPSDASIFWALGFPDAADGWTQESLASNLGSEFGVSLPGFLRRLGPWYAMWLYEHCPNLWELICEHCRPGGSVFVLAEKILGGWSSLSEAERTKYLVRSPLNVKEADGCTCQCSPEGCTPFSWGLLYLGDGYPSRTDVLRAFVGNYGETLTLYQHTTALRQATFEELDMVHICFDKPVGPRDESQLLEDDFYESMDDVEKAIFLDNLVDEFRHFILDGTNNNKEDAERDSQQEAKIDLQRTLIFWDDILPSRMQEFDQELMTTWNPDHELLEDLGVTLWLEEEEDEEESEWESVVTEDSEENRRSAFKELMEKLEMIE
ncbi:hypothetical protein F53441_13958 [Fusarium austroafricanum]|uniref:Uncharacterized protein n=1 Tax=Fusarium austroafricanum TaxID=2364996 RepID=A0A8H4JLT0_9HYPO|nr:hypothetical protein F53441_13958 [Fusarium austroafricanum]